MIITFWSWFFFGAEKSKSGLRLLLNKRIAIHIAIALVLLSIIKADPFEFAARALFPAASILVSMAVAWTSRASTVIQDVEFRSKVIKSSNPLESYVYGYQLSLLIIIIMIVYVSIMASGGISCSLFSDEFNRNSAGFCLYFLLSLAVSQCWQVIDFSNLLTLLHQRVKDGQS